MAAYLSAGFMDTNFFDPTTAFEGRGIRASADRSSGDKQVEPVISEQTFGFSAGGRPIEGYVIGSGSDVVLLVASLHGNEMGGAELLYKLVEELRKRPALVPETKRVLLWIGRGSTKPIAAMPRWIDGPRSNSRNPVMGSASMTDISVFSPAARCTSAHEGPPFAFPHNRSRLGNRDQQRDLRRRSCWAPRTGGSGRRERYDVVGSLSTPGMIRREGWG